MSVTRYKKYKDSGVTWLGDVPEHWGVLPAKRLFAQIRDPSRLEDAQLTASQKYGILPQAAFMEMEDSKVMLALAGLENFKHVEKNDFVISLRSFQGGIEYSAYIGCVSPAYTVLRAREYIVPSYWRYILKDKIYISALQSVTDGIRDGKNISYEQFGNISMPIPTPDEQKSIVNFLDRETVKIDALVAEQERLIGLLKEKRQAVISHAVTKGLNPKAPMKPSGIDWLGDIPAHWEIAALKHIVATPITDGPHETPVFYDEGVPFVSAEGVSSGKIDFTKIRAHISHEDHERYSKKYYPKRNDIFMVKSGATTGVTAIVDTDREFNIWSPLAVIRCGDRALPKFVLHYMRSINFLEAVTLNWSFGTQQNIGMGVIENLHLVLPPIKEQTDIAKKLDNQVVHYEELIAEAQKAIDLLQERRTALISAAVTGKIDVRGILDDSNVTPANDNYPQAEIFAEIVNTLARNGRRHGQISQMKGTFLVEVHLGYADGVKDYEQQAAGPYSKDVMDYGNETGIKNGWFSIEKNGKAEIYRPSKNQGRHFSEGFKLEEVKEIKSLVDLLNNLSNETLEICATLYHCWLMRLNKGLEVTEDVLVDDFENYSSRKKKFTKSQIREGLKWMKQSNITPEYKKPYIGYADAKAKNDKQASLFGDVA